MATLSIGKSLERIKAIDKRAGHVIGNADHVRAQHTDGFSYAIGLGMRIFFLGLSAALFECLMTVIYLIGNPSLIKLAGLTYGFVLYLISRSVYGDDDALVLPLCVDLGIASLVGMAAGIHGVSAEITLQIILPTLFSLVFGILISFQIMSYMFSTVVKAAFHDAPVRRRPSLKRIREAGLLTTEEELLLKTSRWAYAVVAAYIISALILMLAVLEGNVPLSLLSSIAYLVCSAAVLFFGLKIASRERAVITRLRAEGVIKPLVQQNIVVTEVEYGYEFNGVAYPSKQRR